MEHGAAHEKAIDRIRRLLRLAESSNVHEAEVAAARAQELMARHRIEAAMLDVAEADAIRDHRDAPLDASKRLRPWKVQLASVVARANGCRVYVLTQGKVESIVLVGRADDTAFVQVLFVDLVKRVESLTRQNGAGRDRAFCNGFRLGVVTTLEDRLGRANAEAKHRALANVPDESDDASAESRDAATDVTSVGAALARLDRRDEAVDRFMAETLRLSKGRSRSLRADAEGYANGRVAGHVVALDHAARSREP